MHRGSLLLWMRRYILQHFRIRVYGLSEYYISQNPKREYPILLLGYGGLTEKQIADGLQMIDEVLAELKKYQPISVHKE